ncbi:MAG: helix-hairpin-helix domain-containing protein [Gammaproteobacteria bacterium]
MTRAMQRVPGVGPSLAVDLVDLGYEMPADLVGEDPEEMFARLCDLRAKPIDRCVLYVFREAVYYASHSSPEPELLKWWNWSDAKMAARGAGRSGPV